MEINEYLFNHPELGGEEYLSSQFLCDVLHKHGFQVQYPYGNLATAFRGEFVCGPGKKIAVLAEYDALPGYEGGNAHACGHNWISATCVGAVLALKKLASFLNGSLVVIGTPAEETTGGKIDLLKAHAFDDIDAVLQLHLSNENNINVTTLAMDSIQFDFYGVAAHAAGAPHKGINALDAVQLMFAGVNALRGVIQDDARIAGIITAGGSACNIIVDHAACQFYIRAKERAYVNELSQRMIEIAQGASMMTRAKLKYHYFENSFDELKYDETLRTLLKTNLEDLGVHDFVHNPNGGSSDIGNVSQVIPTVYCELDTLARPAVYAHQKEFLDHVHGDAAQETLYIGSAALAMTIYDLLKKEVNE
jgi:amidohydrolase